MEQLEALPSSEELPANVLLCVTAVPLQLLSLLEIMDVSLFSNIIQLILNTLN